MEYAKMKINGLIVAVAVGVAVVLTACAVEETEGTLELRIADMSAEAPGLNALGDGNALHVTGVQAITVIFARVDIHSSANAGNNSAGWHQVLAGSLPVAERTFDLLAVAGGNFEVLGLTTLDVGTYQQVRVIVEDAHITIDGATSPLAIAGGAQTGLKLNHPFTISDGEETTLTLDFDAERSLSESPPGSGNWSLDPVIAVLDG